ncbi:tRNA (adenosine(37)-N6)-dimethylallyltransferase MiaA [Pseudohongiella sp.]|uniref:tRNA (adenosine(37)-N6)-dimethylallyltransferase MiaA n=1 Tax=Pseudohongiella sp. TaxID=1979412 RepID=UPI00295002F9|nr:tRNA (adenosine(37)-N6)-dimethylallyltransferase MiaA [Pseudohongiella sp.]
MAQKCPAICLMGPTASGKTALAIDIVQRFPFAIINVDSAQIYRGMDIGTGKPDAETLRLAPHRLIDFLDPSESYSAARFRSDVIREMADIRHQGRIPLLVGGTMLYFKALRDGLAVLPGADPAVRAQISAMAQQEGWSAVHARLADVDSVAAQRIHPNDPQRLQRALEVFMVTGRSMTDLQARNQVPDNLSEDLMFVSIQPAERSVLHTKIERRFRQMIDVGLVEEVRRLHQRGDLHTGLPSVRSVGYRQVWQYLDGEISFDAMVERGIIATRQLAKRQVTWLRSWDKLHNFDSESPETMAKVLKLIHSASI